MITPEQADRMWDAVLMLLPAMALAAVVMIVVGGLMRGRRR